MKKRKKKKQSKKKNILSVKVAFGAVVFLLILLSILIANNFGFFENAENSASLEIDDECSLVMGNLIHQIRDEGDCKIRCINECSLLDMEFSSIDFVFENSSCHKCNCYCD